jgi:transposase
MAKHEQSIVAIASKTGRRRSFSGPFKRELVEQTLRDDVSVAGVALANGLNTNLLARWRRDYLIAQAVALTPALIPVHVVESQPAPFPSRARPGGDGGSGEIEIRQAGTVLFIRGTPESAVLNLVLRELLQHGSGLPK